MDEELEQPVALPQVQEPDEPTVNLAPSAPPIPDDVIKNRAEKAYVGVTKAGGWKNRSLEDITQGMAVSEDWLRTEATADLDHQRRLLVQDELTRIAKLNGGVTTPEIEDHVKTTIQKLTEPVDQSTVFEEYYSKAFLQSLADNKGDIPNNYYDKALVQIPRELSQVTEIGDTAQAKTELFKTQAENYRALANKQGWGGYLADRTRDTLTLGMFSTFATRGLVPDTSFFEGGFEGSNWEAQRQALASLPIKELAQIYPPLLKQLHDQDPALAADFAESMTGMSIKSIALKDAMDAVNVATLPGVGGGIGIANRIARRTLLGQSKTAVKDLLEVGAQKYIDPSEVIAATGNIPKGTIEKTAERITNPDPVAQAVETLPSGLRTNASLQTANAGNFTRDFVTRIADKSGQVADKAVELLSNMVRVETLPGLQLAKEAATAIRTQVEGRFLDIDSAVLDVGQRIVKEPLTGTWHTSVDIGHPQTGLFTEPASAEGFAFTHGIKSYTVEQKGMGFHLRTYVPLDTTADLFRDTVLDTRIPELKPRDSWLQRLGLHKLSTSEATLSPAESKNRKAMTYGTSVLNQLAHEIGKPIADLARGLVRTDPVTGFAYEKPIKLSFVDDYRRKRWSEFERTLNAAKTYPDPVSGDPGYWFKDTAELEYFYRQNFKRSPDTVEVEAYFATVDLVELDRVMRNISVYRNKARLGGENLRFSALDADGKQVFSPAIDGTLMNKFVSTTDNVLIMGKEWGQEQIVNPRGKHKISKKRMDEMADNVQEGRAQFFKILDPDQNPLAGYGKVEEGHRIRYVYVENPLERNPLSFDQVPRRGGGHIQYDYTHFLKQADVIYDPVSSRYTYRGDKTVMGVPVRAMGQDLVNKMNAVRELMQSGDWAAAESLYKANLTKMPDEWDRFKGWFLPTKTPEGKVLPPRLSVKEPIQVIKNGEQIGKIDNTLKGRYETTNKKGELVDLFHDGTTSGNDMRAMSVDFTQARDSHELLAAENVGSASNPIYQFPLAKTIDTIPMMNRAVNRIASSVLSSDYKLFSMEHWLHRAEPWLQGGTDNRYTPFAAFEKGEWLPNAPAEITSRLDSDRFKIKQLLGTTSKTQAFLDRTAQNMSDWMYEHTGSPRLGLIPNDLLPFAKDASAYIRSMVFHMNLGLFTPAQFFVQAQSYATIGAIAGWNKASSGTAAAVLTQWARLNGSKEIIEALDAKMVNFRMPGSARWLPGQFTESMDLLKRTGFGNVAGEYVLKDSQMMPKLIESNGQKFLNAGAIFFTEGERSVRYGAWHTAYREFRDQFPNMAIGNKEMQTILDRADLLNTNMSRASASVLNHGALSIPMQFYTYQIRMAELFFSNRLGDTLAARTAARGRILAVYSGLYGIPVGLGVTGAPIVDMWRKEALDRGYNVGENWWSSLTNEGIPSYLLGKATGNFYNVGDRYGLQGLRLNGLLSDGSFLKTLTGAAGAKFTDMYSAGMPFFRSIKAMLGLGDPYPLTDTMILDAFRTLSSGNHLTQYILALNYGLWFSKDGGLLERNKVSVTDATFRYISGLQLQNTEDQHRMTESISEREELQKKGLKEFIKLWHRAIDARRQGDQTNADAHEAQANNILKASNFPDHKRWQAISIATKDWEPRAEGIENKFYGIEGDGVPNTTTKTLSPDIQGHAEKLRDAYFAKQKLYEQGIK